MNDKFDLIFQRLDNIIEECVTHEKLQQDLERYTRLSRFVVVEGQLETFVTKSMSQQDKSANTATFDRIFALLDEDYYKVDVIESKIKEVKKIMIDDYTLITTMTQFQAQCDGSFSDMKSTTDQHSKELKE